MKKLRFSQADVATACHKPIKEPADSIGETQSGGGACVGYRKRYFFCLVAGVNVKNTNFFPCKLKY